MKYNIMKELLKGECDLFSVRCDRWIVMRKFRIAFLKTFLSLCLKNNLKTLYIAHIGIDSFRIMKLIFFKTEISFSNTTRTEEKKSLVDWRGCFEGEAVPRSHGLSFILKTPHRRLLVAPPGKSRFTRAGFEVRLLLYTNDSMIIMMMMMVHSYSTSLVWISSLDSTRYHSIIIHTPQI
jgi:hypothetical protein